MDLGIEQKGRRGKEILDDPVFMEMIDTVRKQIMTEWNLTEFEQEEVRERLYYQGRALDEMLRGLRTLVDDWTVKKAKRIKTHKQGRNR